MTEVDLICNFKKCRKRLTSSAWVTSCSHAFCEEDGASQFSGGPHDNKCPACSTPLPGKFDIVKVDLNPVEQFKSVSKYLIILFIVGDSQGRPSWGGEAKGTIVPPSHRKLYNER